MPSRKPVITIDNTVAAPVVRTGAQVVSGSFLVEGMVVFGVPLTDAQGRWLATALSIAIAFAQNLLEKRAGRKLIGTST